MVRPPSAATSGVRAFTVPYMPRLTGLMVAHLVGVHAFNGLAVLAFTVPADSHTLTRSYSLRMLSDLIPKDYKQAIAAFHVPTTFMIGDADEFVVASELARAVHAQRPEIPVIILPGMRHLDLVTQPPALAAIPSVPS
ncbi:MAG: hypothetical protein WAU56_12970 [Steroidobacteraceae bacterium]